MNFDRVVTVKPEHSKDEFLRAARIKLASNIETPIDIVKVDLGEVKESIKEIIICHAHVESNYTASIGYDRQEEYKTTESRYLHEGDWYTYRSVQKRANNGGYYTVDVVKTRTVTDWQPYSGHIGGNVTCVAMNGGEKYSESQLIDVLKTTKDESVIEEGEAEVSDIGMKEVKTNCRRAIESEIVFPGDHYKDVHSDATTDVEKLECWKLPYYEVEYTYNWKKYKISTYACGDLEIEAECPPNDSNIADVAAEETKSYKTGMIIGWALFGIFFILSFILMASVDFYWMWIPTTVVFGIAIAVHNLNNKKFFERIRELTEDNIILKRNELEKVLAQKGYEKLNSSELKLFDAESKGASYAESNKRKNTKLPIVICSIAMIILIIVSLVRCTNA